MPEVIRDLVGGGNLTPVLVVAGLLLLWVAWKAVKLTLKLVALGAGAATLVATAPWAGTALEGPAADCAATAVAAAQPGWEQWLTKRVTVSALSPDAACTPDGEGLAAGTASAEARTFFDVPIRSYEVDPAGARPR